jgi:O-antigen ligase
VLFVLAPEGLVSRLTSTFNAQDPANQDRFAMIEVGALMVRDHPLTGVGPNMVPQVYEQYRPDYAVNETNPHLHNVPLQIAAERGLPALAAWIWFVGVAVVALVRLFRTREPVLAAAALASIGAMLAAGLFEYNFGDSEFLMLFLVLITLPFAASRTDDASSSRP